MRHIILHYHFFKNAGSTFAAALEHNFGKNFASFDSEHYNRRLHPQELVRFVQENPHLVAISSHHLNPLAPHVEGIQFHEVVILRNPVDRIRSMYDFFRRERISEDPLTCEAKRLSLPAFLELLIETQSHLITNPQLNLIAKGGAAILSRQDMDRAAFFLKAVAVIGVVERFDLCALGAEQSLSRVFPHCDLSYVPENVSRGRGSDLRTRLQRFAATCGDHLYRRVVNLNELDSELVKIAAAESLRRFQEMTPRKRPFEALGDESDIGRFCPGSQRDVRECCAFGVARCGSFPCATNRKLELCLQVVGAQLECRTSSSLLK